ncbi:MAG: GyrI-like domain-containing protein [Rhodanobacter sp.]
MLDEPQIVQTEYQHTAVIHLTIPRNQIQSLMGPAIAEVLAAVAAQGMVPAGPVFSHHLRMQADTFDFEVGVPVTMPIAAGGRVHASEWPATTVARTIYHGGYEGLGAAWGELGAWITSAQRSAAPDLWECYVAGPASGSDPAGWRTELNRPLTPA